MQKPLICHEENEAFLDALQSCLSTGLVVLMDGVPLTGNSLKELPFIQEEGLVGHFLRNEQGDFTGISFSKKSDRPK